MIGLNRITALSLTGCISTSPSLPDLYIVSFSKNATSFPEVRLGYFGICAGSNGTISHCQATARSSADALFPTLFPDLNSTGTKSNPTASPTDVKTLLSAALVLQSQIFIPILAGSGLLFLAGLVLLVLLKRNITNPNPDKPRTGELLRLGTMGSLCLSTALSFTASLSTSETAGALQYSALLSAGGAGDSQVLIKPGMALQVLQWLAFGFTLLFTMSVPWLLRGGRGGGGGGEKV
jgi:hypothetical protein